MGASWDVLVSSQMFGYYSAISVSRLEARGCALRRRPAVSDEDGLIEEVRQADAWILGLANATERILEEAKHLRVVAVHGVGVDHVAIAAATRLGICVTNTPAANAGAVAELTIAFLLALSRELVRADAIVRGHGWAPTMTGEEIGGKTLGIVGFGAIGRRVAAMARGMGMRVLAHARSVPARDAAPDVSFVALDELLRESDYVTIHLALNPGTRGMIGARELGLMKPTAYLVNTARGAIVDEGALHRALVDGRLRGAGLDVFSVEPPGDHPLVGLPQVITCSHLGGNTTQGFARMSGGVTASLLSLRDGVQPERLINPEVWSAYVKRWGGATAPSRRPA